MDKNYPVRGYLQKWRFPSMASSEALGQNGVTQEKLILRRLKK
jgi:hypothetical protein